MKKLIRNPFERKKRGTVVSLCIVCALFFITAACGEKTDQKVFSPKNVKLLSCENSTKSTSSNFEEYIKFSTANNGTLIVEQKIVIQCCAKNKDIEVKINSIENNITINLISKDAGCNCACSRIVSYEIGSLKENNTYEFVFLRGGLEYYSCELLFTKRMNCEYKL